MNLRIAISTFLTGLVSVTASLQPLAAQTVFNFQYGTQLNQTGQVSITYQMVGKKAGSTVSIPLKDMDYQVDLNTYEYIILLVRFRELTLAQSENLDRFSLALDVAGLEGNIPNGLELAAPAGFQIGQLGSTFDRTFSDIRFRPKKGVSSITSGIFKIPFFIVDHQTNTKTSLLAVQEFTLIPKGLKIPDHVVTERTTLEESAALQQARGLMAVTRPEASNKKPTPVAATFLLNGAMLQILNLRGGAPPYSLEVYVNESERPVHEQNLATPGDHHLSLNGWDLPLGNYVFRIADHTGNNFITSETLVYVPRAEPSSWKIWMIVAAILIGLTGLSFLGYWLYKKYIYF